MLAACRPKGVFPSAVLWTPLTLGSALIAWWDAQALASLTFNSGNVASWTDVVGGRVASQGTGANQPGYSATSRNSKPGLSFNGSTQVLTFTPTGLPSASAASVLALAGFSNTTGAINLAFNYGANASQGIRSIGKTSSNLAAAFGQSNDQTAAESWASVDRFVVSMTPAGASPTQSLYVDGGSAENQSMTTFNTVLTSGRIGNYIPTGTLFWNGVIQQILVCNATLTTSQRQKLEGWESWYDGKAGANLPGGHPYKSRAPFVSDP